VIEVIVFALCVSAFGYVSAWLGQAYDEMCATVRCACGRRELRDVLCGPEDRPALARELTRACFSCTPPPPARRSSLTTHHPPLITPPEAAHD